jgi:membrane-associated protein
VTRFLDPHYIIQTFGLIGVVLAIYAESGLLIGIFLPGDSLLFTAGLFASTEKGFSLEALLIFSFVAAVLGDSTGYTIGRRTGPALFKRDDSRFFKKRHLERATHFYERHGRKTIVLARFVPIVRTLAPMIAGATAMPYKTFFAFNVIGGLLWAIGVPTAGYFLGKSIPSIDRYLLPIIAVIVLVSILPTLIHVIRLRGHKEPLAPALAEVDPEDAAARPEQEVVAESTHG